MDIHHLFPETCSNPISISNMKKTNQQNGKYFAFVVSRNVYDIPLSQLLVTCLKGDRLAITIPEDEYNLGVEACKHHLHGIVVWSKISAPLKVVNLKNKLMELWLYIEQ